MKEWLSNQKNIIKLTVSVSIVLILAVCIIIGIANGYIGKFFGNFFSIISPIIIGFVIAYLCNPVVKFFERTIFKKIHRINIKRALSIICAFVLIISILAFILVMIIPEIIAALDDLINNYISNYKESIPNAVNGINSFLRRYSIFDFIPSINPEPIVSWVETDVSKFISQLITKDAGNSAATPNGNEGVFDLIGYVFSVGSSIVEGIKNFFIGLFISFYMLMAKEKCKAHTRRLLHAMFAPKRVRGIIRFGKLMNHSFGGFIEGKIMDSFIIAFISCVTFLIFGMPSPYLLATIIGLTDLIPIFGPIIGSIPCAVIVLLMAPSKLIIFLILILLIQQLEGNIISPLILGDRVNISSLSVIISIVVMGGLFGVAGMLIGVPVFAVAIHMTQNWISNKLRAKGMGTEIEEYYFGDTDEFVEETDRSNKLIVKVFKAIGGFFKMLWKKIFKKKDKADDTENNTEENKDSNQEEK